MGGLLNAKHIYFSLVIVFNLDFLYYKIIRLFSFSYELRWLIYEIQLDI